MNPAQLTLVSLLRVYRYLVSPAKSLLFGPLGRCRFTPSCSEYALEAVRAHGAGAGACLAVKRLARCHPWGGCGHDPVPLPNRGLNHSPEVFSTQAALSRRRYSGDASLRGHI